MRTFAHHLNDFSGYSQVFAFAFDQSFFWNFSSCFSRGAHGWRIWSHVSHASISHVSSSVCPIRDSLSRRHFEEKNQIKLHHHLAYLS